MYIVQCTYPDSKFVMVPKYSVLFFSFGGMPNKSGWNL